MAKNLIICPNCIQKGKKSVLGEIDPDGFFAILRFHNGYTRIKGNDFAVYCGVCSEPTYIRKEERGTDSNIGVAWIHRESFSGTFSGTLTA